MNLARAFLSGIALCSFVSCAYVSDWREARLQKHNEMVFRQDEALSALNSHSTTPAKFDEAITLANQQRLRFDPAFWRTIINHSTYPRWQRQKCREQLKSPLTVYDT